MIKKNKPFTDLNQFQLGFPPPGLGYLWVNLRYLEGISPEAAIAKIDAMGYKPQLRYMVTESGIDACLLLKVVEIQNSTTEEQLGEAFESLTLELHQEETIAVQCMIGKPSVIQRSEQQTTVTSA
ncbi:MAG: hypothetical protein ACPGVO_15575 [Spirulinaceae cyanobacterium]